MTAEVLINGAKKQIVVEKANAGGGSSNHRKADPLNPDHIALPFAGVAIEVLVELGDQVDEAETIAVFRQGKMELDVRAPFSGTVTELTQFEEGEAVGVGALIAIINSSKGKARLKVDDLPVIIMLTRLALIIGFGCQARQQLVHQCHPWIQLTSHSCFWFRVPKTCYITGQLHNISITSFISKSQFEDLLVVHVCMFV